MLSALRLTALRLTALRLTALRLTALRLSALRLTALRLTALRLTALRLTALRLTAGRRCGGRLVPPRYQVSMWGRRLCGWAGARGLRVCGSSNSCLIQRRVSAGSITSSISKYSAMLIPLPRS
jgi:hypothetical protein